MGFWPASGFGGLSDWLADAAAGLIVAVGLATSGGRIWGCLLTSSSAKARSGFSDCARRGLLEGRIVGLHARRPWRHSRRRTQKIRRERENRSADVRLGIQHQLMSKLHSTRSLPHEPICTSAYLSNITFSKFKFKFIERPPLKSFGSFSSYSFSFTIISVVTKENIPLIWSVSLD